MYTTSLHRYLLIFMLLICSPVMASTDQERHELYRIVVELEYIESILIFAKSTKADDDGTGFDYEKFKQDVELIKDGVKRYIAKERREPRVLRKINGGEDVGR